MMPAVPSSTAWVVTRLAASSRMEVPVLSSTSMIVVWGTSRPPLASTPYARTRSLGWTSSTPRAKERPASVGPPAKVTPIDSALAWMVSVPMTATALTAGMLSENRKASRTRTGPRSSGSASCGVYPPPKSVTTSMNMLAPVMTLASMPVAYTTGLKADPGWRQPSARTSNRGWNRFVAFVAVGSAEPW